MVWEIIEIDAPCMGHQFLAWYSLDMRRGPIHLAGKQLEILLLNLLSKDGQEAQDSVVLRWTAWVG